MTKQTRTLCVAFLVISVSVCLCIILLRNGGYMEVLELAAYDRYVCLNTRGNALDPRIVLITISEEDIQGMKKWPLTDSLLAQAVNLLMSYKPRVIGVDIYRDIPVPPGREALSEVLHDSSDIVTVMKIGDAGSAGVGRPYVLEDNDRTGFNDILVDSDGIVRRGLLFLDDGEVVYPSFSLLLAMLYLDDAGIVPQPDQNDPEHMRLGRTTMVPFEADDGGYAGADARGYQFLLDFRGAKAPFRSLSLTELLSGRIEEDTIEDTIVLIGSTAESLCDFFHTPIKTGSDRRMSGVELHAHITGQLLRGAVEGKGPMKSPDEGVEWAWIFLWGIMGGLIALWRLPLIRFSITVISGLLVLVVCTFFIFARGWWVPVVPPALSWFIAAALVTAFLSYREKAEKNALMQLFSRHVSDGVARTLWEQRDQFMDGRRPRSQRLIATVLFADLRGFTTISERLDPEGLVAWLNEYAEAMAHVIIEHGGVINKYLGDGIMAVFGVPVPRSCEAEVRRDAIHALDCAVAMSRSMQMINAQWDNRGLPTTCMRIGIYTGPLVAGCIGGTKRMEYTVIGDTVNIASRLEGFRSGEEAHFIRKDGCRIFIGDPPLSLVSDIYETEMVATALLKGKGEQITVYSVKGHREGRHEA
ncbi:MAG: CHASE2 domain-containing protein [bacterium]